MNDKSKNKKLIEDKEKELKDYKRRFMDIAFTVTPQNDRIELIAMFGACLSIQDEINQLINETK